MPTIRQMKIKQNLLSQHVKHKTPTTLFNNYSFFKVVNWRADFLHVNGGFRPFFDYNNKPDTVICAKTKDKVKDSLDMSTISWEFGNQFNLHPFIGTSKKYKGFDTRIIAVKDKKLYRNIWYDDSFICNKVPDKALNGVTAASIFFSKYSVNYYKENLRSISFFLFFWSRIYRSNISENKKFMLFASITKKKGFLSTLEAEKYEVFLKKNKIKSLETAKGILKKKNMRLNLSENLYLNTTALLSFYIFLAKYVTQTTSQFGNLTLFQELLSILKTKKFKTFFVDVENLKQLDASSDYEDCQIFHYSQFFESNLNIEACTSIQNSFARFRPLFLRNNFLFPSYFLADVESAINPNWLSLLMNSVFFQNFFFLNTPQFSSLVNTLTDEKPESLYLRGFWVKESSFPVRQSFWINNRFKEHDKRVKLPNTIFLKKNCIGAHDVLFESPVEAQKLHTLFFFFDEISDSSDLQILIKQTSSLLLLL